MHTNGICYICGEKYSPDHQCVVPKISQVKAIEVQETQSILSKELLDVVSELETHHPTRYCHVSLYVKTGAIQSKFEP